jgi:hypothetical protein
LENRTFAGRLSFVIGYALFPQPEHQGFPGAGRSINPLKTKSEPERDLIGRSV